MTRRPSTTDEAKRLSDYIDVDNKQFQTNLKTVESTEDARSLFMAHTKRGFNLNPLFDSDSEYALTIVDKMKNQIQKKLVEPEPEIPKIQRIEQKTKRVGGKAYFRTKPQKFSKKEITFIQRAIKRKISNEELVRRYNAISTFRIRTKSSILTKKYRLS